MRKTFFKMLTVWLAFVVVVAACSGSQSNSNSDQPNDEESVLKFANSISAQTLSPSDDQTPATLNIYNTMFESLVRQAPNGEIEPDLAESWETSDDGKTVVFNLKEGITFSDGEPFDAEAVVANIDFIKTAEPSKVIPPVAGQLAIVESVEATDELTVQFNLSVPGEALLISALSRNSGLMVSPTTLGTSGENPVGTGPYVYNKDESNSDNTELVLDANKNYWRGELDFSQLHIDFVKDPQTRLDSFNTGDQYDIAVVNFNQTSGIEGNFTKAPTVRVGFVIADWQGETIPQLANKDARCAIAQALNSKAIQEQLNSPGSELDQFATGPDDYAYIEDLAVPEFDIEAAKQAYSATGLDGFEFTNGHLPPSGFPETSSAYATALQELGITMNNEMLSPVTGAQMFKSLAEGTYPIQVIPFSEPNALMSLLPRTGKGTFNPSGVSPEGVDELVASARTKSLADAEEDVAAAWKIMLEECIWIMNSQLETAVAYSDDVEGVEHTVGIPNHFYLDNIRQAQK